MSEVNEELLGWLGIERDFAEYIWDDLQKRFPQLNPQTRIKETDQKEGFYVQQRLERKVKTIPVIMKRCKYANGNMTLTLWCGYSAHNNTLYVHKEVRWR